MRTVQPLNYCRQMVRQIRERTVLPGLGDDQLTKLEHLASLASEAQKFILPIDAELLRDDELRALPDDCELRLPHAVCALEFETSILYQPKAIVFAVDTPEVIRITHALFHSGSGLWFATGTVAEIQKHGRSFVGMDKKLAAFAVLKFLNALACSNIRMEAVPPKRGAMVVKSAIPFDTYHILTVGQSGHRSLGISALGGEGRSLREHLRRGHIRRCESGLRVWVNATVVNSGVGGKVTKDYKLATRAANNEGLK